MTTPPRTVTEARDALAVALATAMARSMAQDPDGFPLAADQPQWATLPYHAEDWLAEPAASPAFPEAAERILAALPDGWTLARADLAARVEALEGALRDVLLDDVARMKRDTQVDALRDALVRLLATTERIHGAAQSGSTGHDPRCNRDDCYVIDEMEVARTAIAAVEARAALTPERLAAALHGWLHGGPKVCQMCVRGSAAILAALAAVEARAALTPERLAAALVATTIFAGHAHDCPVWMNRMIELRGERVDLDTCTCWVKDEAPDRARRILAALATDEAVP